MMTKSISLLNRDKIITIEDFTAVVPMLVNSDQASSTAFWAMSDSWRKDRFCTFSASSGSSVAKLVRVGTKLLEAKMKMPATRHRKLSSTMPAARLRGSRLLKISTGLQSSSSNSREIKKIKAKAGRNQKAENNNIKVMAMINDALCCNHKT